MPQNKLQDVVFTLIMASVMVYGMVTYNVALSTGTVELSTFTAGARELAIMIPVAFVLEFFVVGKIAPKLAFSVVRPTDRPQFITYAISICICCIMCPVMSLIATFLFMDATLATWFPTWIHTWVLNFPMAICYQLFYCGPFVRLIFRAIFCRTKEKDAIGAHASATTEGAQVHHGNKEHAAGFAASAGALEA